jgi:hypothetical protein
MRLECSLGVITADLVALGLFLEPGVNLSEALPDLA